MPTAQLGSPWLPSAGEAGAAGSRQAGACGMAVSGVAPARRPDGPLDLVRLTVTARGRRRDLVLPARVPVGELVPGLAGLLGLASLPSCAGWTLVGCDAGPLDPEGSLLVQGVTDGVVLTLAATSELADLGGFLGSPRPTPGVVHDDVVEAVAEAVGDLGPRWGVAGRRAATRVAASLLCLLGLGGLLAQVVRDPFGPVAPA
ncbi:MAG: EsaB/YukD family protein, partial [Actinomycetota bacterium]|nr:EsaB/YukD family protein [Actinomycetota bacterium]